MGQGQGLRLAGDALPDEQVDVQGPGPVVRLAHPAQSLLDGQALVQQGLGLQLGLQEHAAVEIGPLLVGHVKGLCLVDVGKGQHLGLGQLFDPVQALGQVVLPVP